MLMNINLFLVKNRIFCTSYCPDRFTLIIIYIFLFIFVVTASEDAERGERPRSDTLGRHTSLTDYFRRTKYFKDMERETQNIMESYQNKDDIHVADLNYPTSFFTQVSQLWNK